MTIIDIIKDDELAHRVARQCNDKSHDSRWCATCDAREDAIADYREALFDQLRKETKHRFFGDPCPPESAGFRLGDHVALYLLGNYHYGEGFVSGARLQSDGQYLLEVVEDKADAGKAIDDRSGFSVGHVWNAKNCRPVRNAVWVNE